MVLSTIDRIHRVVSDVFGVATDSIDDDSSPDTIESWDSMFHLNLILALEAEFGVSLVPEDAMELLSVGLIRNVLADYGVSGAV